MEDKIRLSGRELDVMGVFWQEEKSLTAKNIVDINTSLSINTVQSVIKGLLKKKYIEISEIVYSGTVLTRSYKPVLTADEYLIGQLTSNVVKNISTEGVMATLLNQEIDQKTIENLEELLKQRKEQLKKG